MIVETVEQVDDVIERAWNTNDSVVIDFRVEREANVFPIVPQGKGIGEIMTEAPEVVGVR
jgi:acetolactate synthase-1/2/3 large subunit